MTDWLENLFFSFSFSLILNIDPKRTVKLLHRKQIPSLFLNFDISKAFDSVAWPFLLEVLRHHGFGYKWINLIAMLLRTSSPRALINGNPSEHIAHARGLLRSGDPISPMIFLLVIDVLDALIRRFDQAQVLAYLRPWGIKHRASLFVDDVALFLSPYPGDLQCTCAILDLFDGASGLKVNLAKCAMVSNRCQNIDLEPRMVLLRCTIKSFPIKYLGLSVSQSRLRNGDCYLWWISWRIR